MHDLLHRDAAALERRLARSMGQAIDEWKLIEEGDRILVGISGGKDSTATLYEVVQMGFKPLAFSMDTGYYPKHIFPRAAAVAKQLGVDYVKIDAGSKMRPADRACFAKTAELYGEPDSEQLREKFRKWYGEGRRHYSVKCAHEIPFVRTCQLCRRLIVRAYYEAAVKRAIVRSARRVVLVADSEKFDRELLVGFAPLSAVDVLVTDAAPGPDLAAALDEAGVEVWLA